MFVQYLEIIESYFVHISCPMHTSPPNGYKCASLDEKFNRIVLISENDSVL